MRSGARSEKKLSEKIVLHASGRAADGAIIFMKTALRLAACDQQRVVDPPDCTGCGSRMRLATVAPHTKFIRLNVHRYGCQCGRISEEAVPREG